MYLSFIFCLLQLRLCNSIPKTRKMSLIDLWPLGLIFNSYLAFKKISHVMFKCIRMHTCSVLQSQKTTWGVDSFLYHVDLRDCTQLLMFGSMSSFFFFKWSQYIESVTQYAYVCLRAGSYHGPVCSPGWDGTHCWQFFCHSLPSVGVIGAKHHTILFWGFNCRTPIHAG